MKCKSCGGTADFTIHVYGETVHVCRVCIHLDYSGFEANATPIIRVEAHHEEGGMALTMKGLVPVK